MLHRSKVDRNCSLMRSLRMERGRGRPCSPRPTLLACLFFSLLCNGASAVPLQGTKSMPTSTASLGGVENKILVKGRDLILHPGWVQLSREDPESSCKVQLTAAVRLNGLDVLQNKFDDCSDPTSPRFADHWTREQLRSQVNVSEHSLHQVKTWFEAAGLTVREEPHMTAAGFVQAVGTAPQIEALLSVRLHRFVHKDFPYKTILRTLDPISVPHVVHPLLDFISGVNELPSLHTSFQTAPGPSFLEENREDDKKGDGRPPQSPAITPDVLVHLYGIEEAPAPHAEGSLGAAGWQWQAFSAMAALTLCDGETSSGDLHTFQKRFGLQQEDVTRVIGKGKSWWGHVEGNLDVEYLMAVSRATPHGDNSTIAMDYWLSPGFGFDVVKWAVQVQSDGHSPLVWSLSYGEGLSTVSVPYAQRLNSEFMKLAVLGVSVLVASGDSGVYALQGTQGTFNPSFPACLPAVTAVGATQLNPQSGEEDSGTPWSGGGFALQGYFPRASAAAWQAEAVERYFAVRGGGLPAEDKWNRDGRAIPDVSAVGVNYKAALIALLNDARMALTPPKKALGHLNGFLYKSNICRDITQGRNDAGRESGGFDADVGWDPVTGMGTPDYPKWREAAMALP